MTGKFLIFTFSAPDRKKALIQPVKSEQLETKYRGIDRNRLVIIIITIAYKIFCFKFWFGKDFQFDVNCIKKSFLEIRIIFIFISFAIILG